MISARSDESITVANKSIKVGSSNDAGDTGSIVWPSDSSNRAASSAAATHSGSVSTPCIACVRNPMRKRPGSTPTSS